MECRYFEIECKYADVDSNGFVCLGSPDVCPYGEPVMEKIKEGHTRHCACRIVHGDGKCECGMSDGSPEKKQRECPSCGAKGAWKDSVDLTDTKVDVEFGCLFCHCRWRERYILTYVGTQILKQGNQKNEV